MKKKKKKKNGLMKVTKIGLLVSPAGAACCVNHTSDT